MTFFLVIFTIALVLVSLFAVLLILMQRPSENAGFGSSLGGSTVESIFGGDAGSVLLKATIKCMVFFFVLAMGVSMLYIHRAKSGAHQLSDQLPSLQAVEEISALPAETAPTTSSVE